MHFDYIRDYPSIAMLLVDPSNTTIFVPTNHAILSLSRQPHQAPELISQKFNYYHTAQEEEDATRAHLEQFVRVHVVPQGIDMSLEEEWQTLLKGRKIWIKLASNSRHGNRTRQVVVDGDNEIEIVDVVEVN